MDTGNLLASLIIFTCGYARPGGAPRGSSASGILRHREPRGVCAEHGAALLPRACDDA